MAGRRRRGISVAAMAAVAGVAVGIGLGGTLGVGLGVVAVAAAVGWRIGWLTRRGCVRVARRLAGGVGRGLRAVLGRSWAAWEAARGARAGARAWAEVVGAAAGPGGVALVRVGAIAERLGMARRDRLSPRRSAELAGSAASAGLDVEPDVRAGGRKSYGWEQVVAVYRAGPGAGPGASAGSTYLGASAIFRMALYVAGADGAVGPEEVGHVAESLREQFGLGPGEARRLEALRALLAADPPSSIAGLGKDLQARLGAQGRDKVGRVLVGVAAADGVVGKAEVARLRASYRALGLDPAALDTLLAEVRKAAEPRPVTKAGVAPAAPAEGTVAIDPERLRRVLGETEDVARILGEAIREAEAEAGEEVVPTPATAPAALKSPEPAGADPRLSGLDARYRGAVGELLGRAEWSPGDFEALARRHGLMPTGAVEAINEWSQEALGDLLLEPIGDPDAAGLRVHPELLANATVPTP